METLNKTWFVDIDGTFLKHNSNIGLDDLIKEKDSHLKEIPIPKSIKFLRDLPKNDKIIITTARESHHREHTIKTLKHLGVRYDDILFDLSSQIESFDEYVHHVYYVKDNDFLIKNKNSPA